MQNNWKLLCTLYPGFPENGSYKGTISCNQLYCTDRYLSFPWIPGLFLLMGVKKNLYFRINLIMNKMKTVHYYDFIKVRLRCQSAISCTFGHMFLFDILLIHPFSDHHFITFFKI